MFLISFQIVAPLIVLKLLRNSSLKPLASYSYSSWGFLVVFFLTRVILHIVFNLIFSPWPFSIKSYQFN